MENHGVVSPILTPGISKAMNIFLSQFSPVKFFQPGYIFEITPPADGLYLYLGIMFVLALAWGMIIAVRAKKKEKIFRKLQFKVANLLIFFGVFGLLLTFFRFEGIAYLGSRLAMLFMLVISLGWGFGIGWYKFFSLPREREKYEKQKIFEKYLPTGR